MADPVPARPPRGAPRSGRARAEEATVRSLPLPDGRRLAARCWVADGPGTLVVLHGLLDSSEGWRALSGQLSGTVVAIDLPGFGLSDPAPIGSMAGYAQDVADALAQLGIDRYALLGHSLGGAVAAALAERSPAAVSALMLLAPAGFGRIGLAELASVPGVRDIVQAALPFALSSRLAVAATFRTMIANGRAPEPEIVDRILARAGLLRVGAREALRAIVESGRSPQAFHRRELAYRGPVQVIWGERDRLVPPGHRHGVRRALPQAQIDVWPAMGHHPLCERPGELFCAIRRLLAVAESSTNGESPSDALTAAA
jgi:pimeloyl-ACP methyl ester carboxylesterase